MRDPGSIIRGLLIAAFAFGWMLAARHRSRRW
jgi:hypothetical protein